MIVKGCESAAASRAIEALNKARELIASSRESVKQAQKTIEAFCEVIGTKRGKRKK